MIRITFDPAKREVTLERRGLDFADAGLVFRGRYVTALDDRQDYGEPRYISVGVLEQRSVVIVWTPRDGSRRIISMRYAHAKEVRWWRNTLD